MSERESFYSSLEEEEEKGSNFPSWNETIYLAQVLPIKPAARGEGGREVMIADNDHLLTGGGGGRYKSRGSR